MDTPYQSGPDVTVLPSTLPLPGAGVLTVNAYVVHAAEPVLVDTGIAADGERFVDALSSVVDPARLGWVWLTHDDADHTGNVERVLELAPQARLVTHAMAALRMATWWPVPLERVHAVRPGDRLDVGDRTLTAVRPPLFDNPMAAGVLDGRSGALFTVDAFGAILPEPAEDAADVPGPVLAGGMTAWATFDTPWAHLVDRERFGAVLDGVRRLQPSRILSSHLPAARGEAIERFLEVLASVPDAEPFHAPDHVAFGHIAAAIAAAGAPAPA